MGRLVKNLPQALLKEYFDYDHVRGRLLWKKLVKKNSKAVLGEVAGYCGSGRTPRWTISVCGAEIKLHRAIWIWHFGEIGQKIVDHKDGNGLNNLIDNLRLATDSENSANRKKPSGSLGTLKGACKVKNYDRWASSITHNGTRYHLGYFASEIAAHEAYCLKASELFGEFARAA
jgi:hypothetical protein